MTITEANDIFPLMIERLNLHRLAPNGGRGITEIRSILGGVFVGLGVMALVLNSRDAFFMLGATYLMVALVRLVSMFVDKSVERSNVISVVTEVFFGLVLVL